MKLEYCICQQCIEENIADPELRYAAKFCPEHGLWSNWRYLQRIKGHGMSLIYWPEDIPNDLEPELVTSTAVVFYDPTRTHSWRTYDRHNGLLVAACISELGRPYAYAAAQRWRNQGQGEPC